MVKVERVTLTTPDLPVPPGFSLKTPTAKRATASVADGSTQPFSPPPSEEASRDQKGHNMQEQPPGLITRRTSRKRVQPQFYSPAQPQQYRRRRSRPSKARSMSQLSYQEKVIGNCNRPSTILSRWQEQMTHVPPAIHFTGEQSSSQINVQLGKETNETTTTATTTPLPNQQTEQAPSTMEKTHGITVDKNRQASDTNMKTNLVLTLNAINEKHGDITKDCSLESDRMKTLVLFGICEVVQDLQKKQLKDLDLCTLESCYSAVKDAERMKMNVKWLRNRLDEIKDAIESAGEALKLMDEKERLMENIDNKRKDILLRKGELKRLYSEIEEMEGQVTRDIVIIEELDKNIRTQTSKFQHLEQMPLLDLLL